MAHLLHRSTEDVPLLVRFGTSSAPQPEPSLARRSVKSTASARTPKQWHTWRVKHRRAYAAPLAKPIARVTIPARHRVFFLLLPASHLGPGRCGGREQVFLNLRGEFELGRQCLDRFPDLGDVRLLDATESLE